jgi:hypothetical protein
MIDKVISGGQTGVDRAGLDAAMLLGLNVGGWCPKGRMSEDGRIPDKYPLTEIPNRSYPERTEMNLLEADGTLIVFRDRLDKGTKLTADLCEKYRKPYMLLSIEVFNESVKRGFVCWLADYRILTLNVAGNRESASTGIYEKSKIILSELLNFLVNDK